MQRKTCSPKCPEFRECGHSSYLGKRLPTHSIILTTVHIMVRNGGQVLIRTWPVADNPIQPIQQERLWSKETPTFTSWTGLLIQPLGFWINGSGQKVLAMTKTVFVTGTWTMNRKS